MKRINLFKKVGAFLLAFMLVLSSTGVVSAATQYSWSLGTVGKGTIKCITEGYEYDGGDNFLNNQTDYTFEITPAEGYRFTKLEQQGGHDVTDVVKAQGVEENGGTFTWRVTGFASGFVAYFEEIKEETPVDNKWPWVLRSGGHGYIKCYAGDLGDYNFEKEEEVEFEIVPEDGYEFDKLYSMNENGDLTDVTDQVIDNKVTWTIRYPGGLKVTFKEIKKEEPVVPTSYTWSIMTGGHGYIKCYDGDLGDHTFDIREEVEFEIVPEDGYELDTLYYFDDKGVEREVEAKDIVGNKVTWTIAYNGGFRVTFKEIKEDTPVETPEESNTYIWSLRSGGNGYIKCYDGDLGDHTFAKGEEVEFEIVANEGYEFDKLYSIDQNGDLHEETDHVKDNKVTWTIAYNGGLLVTFKEIRHHDGWRWGLLNDGNGTIGCTELGFDGGEEFVQEGTYTFEIKANEGFEFDKLFLLVNGNETDVTEYVVDGASVEWRVAYDGALKATFVKVEEETPVEPEEPTPFYGWRWGLLSDGNGTIGCTELGFDGGEEFVQEGTYTFEIKANEGYKFDKLYLVVDGNETDVTEYVVDGASVEWRVAYDGALKATFVKVEEETPVAPEDPTTPADPEDKTEDPATPADKTETPADATKTGDATAFLPFVAVMMVSAAGAAIVLKKRYHA